MKRMIIALAVMLGATASGVMAAEVPTDSEALFQYLSDRGYADFPAEIGTHKGEGPHLRRGRPVRVFYTPELAASITNGAATHPAGSAMIKEIYDADAKFQGWAVMVKTDDDSARGKNWYYFEALAEGRVLTAGQGVGGCIACHQSGNDFVLSYLPFE